MSGGRVQATQVLSWAPRVFRIPDVVSDSECRALIALATPSMRGSVALDTTVENKRTSDGTFFGGEQADHPVVLALRERVSALVLMPPEHAEPMQMLRYLPGQEYKPHVDFIPPKSADAAARLRKGGQRVVTALLYLNDVEQGGETTFPRAGLTVPPHMGDALVFFNVLPNLQVDRRTLHAGAPVVQGTKWLATLWFRERPYAGLTNAE